MVSLINEIYSKNIEISFWDCGGLGDRIKLTMLPENWFKTFGKKLINITNSYVYKYNPYVIVKSDMKSAAMIDLHSNRIKFKNYYIPLKDEKAHSVRSTSFGSKVCGLLDIKCYRKDPRLYLYEDEKTVNNRIVIHGEGRSVPRIPQNVIEYIAAKYKDYEIIQIGDEQHKLLHPSFVDKRQKFDINKNENIWANAKLIASASLFIGVISGFAHLANAYDQVRKKIFCKEDPSVLEQIIPMAISQWGWYDFGVEYFNYCDHDIGISKSFLRI